jgi:hypothetical protein
MMRPSSYIVEAWGFMLPKGGAADVYVVRLVDHIRH